MLIGVLLMTACANFKKVQVIQDAISKNVAVDSMAIAEKARLDSIVMIDGLVKNIAATKMVFTTMNARFKVDYESPKSAEGYIANISLTKDSSLYITVRGAMGVIGLKAMINKDSAILIFPLSKKVERHPLSYLQDVINIPLNYKTIEDLIVGNPIFMDSVDMISYSFNDQKLQVSLIGTLFKNLIILSEDNSKVLQLKLDDVDIAKHRTCDIAYSNHTSVNNFQFPMNRNIAITAQTKLEIKMEVKEFNFDEPLKYTFSIPKQGKRK